MGKHIRGRERRGHQRYITEHVHIYFIKIYVLLVFATFLQETSA